MGKLLICRTTQLLGPPKTGGRCRTWGARWRNSGQEPLGKPLGEPLNVDCKCGAVGNVASQFVASVKAGGYRWPMAQGRITVSRFQSGCRSRPRCHRRARRVHARARMDLLEPVVRLSSTTRCCSASIASALVSNFQALRSANSTVRRSHLGVPELDLAVTPSVPRVLGCDGRLPCGQAARRSRPAA